MKQEREQGGSGWAAALLYSLVIVAFAQFYLDVLINNFMVSLGIVLLPLFLTIFTDFPLMKVSVLAGLGVALSRALTHLLIGTPPAPFSTAYLPEAFFYIVYGILLYFYYDPKKRNLTRPHEIIILMLIDYAANMAELVLRGGVQNYTFNNQLWLLAFGLVRGGGVFILIHLFQQLKLRLMRQEDVNMYQKLMLTVTELSDETVCMQEQMSLVEQTVRDAYLLYDGLKQEKNGLEQKALGVATNVHEIKKSYESVMRGIRRCIRENVGTKQMPLSEMLRLLLKRAEAFAEERDVELRAETDLADAERGLVIADCFDLMSVFNNLFTNAIEAAVNGRLHLSVSVREEGDQLCFCVANDGKQIDAEDLETIFEAGFSTKINYNTGKVGRGLGLFVVKDIIEKRYQGTISVSSVPKRTEFTFCIAKKQLNAPNQGRKADQKETARSAG